MLTIAYIGNGKSTNRYHLPFATQVEGITVKTIYNRSLKDTWQRLAGVTYTTDLQAVLQDPQIQLVVVATPAHTHVDFATACLNHGKHVLVEKPFCRTAKEAEELFELAKAKNLLLQCYQNRRFDSDFLTTQAVIERGVLGTILEVEMHFDYYRPEIPEANTGFSALDSFLYGHGCHTLDQALSYFGQPERVHYDVRQLLGEGRMNDYFDIDLYYGPMKVSVKSSYFRLKERPSFVVYGTKGVFVKQTKDRQEADLKRFYLPGQADFGQDQPEHYGLLTYLDESGQWHEERVPSLTGDYSRIYEGLYRSIIHGEEKIVKDHETIQLLNILEAGIAPLH